MNYRVEYETTGEFRATNDGHSVWLWREGNSSELAISFLPEEQYHLDAINWHFGTEPMNGSEHTIGGERLRYSDSIEARTVRTEILI